MTLVVSMTHHVAAICFLFLFTTPSSKSNAATRSHPQTKTPPDNRPNVILLLTDDQDVSLGGLDQMPLLKQHLLHTGTTFLNAFVHTPICCPSRSSILSGIYLHNGGAVDNSVNGNCDGPEWQANAERRTFATYAKEAGYVTSYAGKYLNTYGRGNKTTSPRVPPGWDKWFGLIGNSRYYNVSIVESNDGGRTSRIRDYGDSYRDDYLPDLVANRTLDTIRHFTSSQSERTPFLIVNAWPTPHQPWTPAPWAEHAFDGASAPRTENWNASSYYMQQKHWFLRQLDPIDDETTTYIDSIYENRLESLLSVDRHVGQIIHLLEDKGELDNTVIIYMSDNGYQLGQHRLAYDKRQLYEHDIRVPFVVTGPGVPRNVTTDYLVVNIDVAPTIRELVTMGSVVPSGDMDGVSFLPFLKALEEEEKEEERSSTTIQKKHVDRPRLHRRNDFLISYHGVGRQPCGLWECPPPSPLHEGDCWNNTYHCLRTLNHHRNDSIKENTIYCEFEDDENFVEYYDLTIDEWQLENRYGELNSEKKRMLEARLAQLRSCKGDSCHSFPVLEDEMRYVGDAT